MKIGSSFSSDIVPAAPITRADKAESSVASATDEVEIAGHSLLLSRLFNGVEPASTPKRSGNGIDYLTEYLTEKDIGLLEKMYAYSAENGIDLTHVDMLATDLGNYRLAGANPGSTGLYDATGHRLTISFSKQDQEAAARIAQAQGLSELDQGFLGSVLTVGGHGTNFNFLERMVNVFSSSGDAVENSPVANFDADRNKLDVVAEAEASLVIPVPDFAYDRTANTWTYNRGAGASDPVADQIKDVLQTKNANADIVGLILGYARHTQTSGSAVLQLMKFL